MLCKFSTAISTLAFTSVLTVTGVNAAASSTINPLRFATKTAYWDQRNASVSSTWEPTSCGGSAPVQASDLELVQLQQVSRHGSRYPTDGNTEEIVALLGMLQTNYSSVIPDWLRSHSTPFNDSVAGELASAGWHELEAYGERTHSSVGSSFPTTYNESTFKLAHTYKSRTADSAIAFASTYFENPDDVQYIEYAKGEDPLLRFFDVCDRYLEEVKDNSSALPELDIFDASARINASIADLKANLNLPDDAELSLTDAKAAWSACAFDIALYGKYDEWCTVLDETSVDYLDYEKDLKAYYKKGPGYKISYEMAAVLLQDVFTYMKNFTTGDTDIVGNLRFGHAETTLPLMTLLGYGDRTPLLASWTDEQIKSRDWRTSQLAPTASNVDFRLYRGKTDGKYYVQVMIQEIVAPLPGCDEVYCELSKVEALWDYYINDYNFEADCTVETA